ncbi:hypothetical protein CRYUN_Cryun09bG0153800 [Craigia yunnanensis]
MELRKRIHGICSLCPMCTKEETLEHLFFLCPCARATWFGMDLSIRTDHLELTSLIDWIKDWLSKLELTQPDALWFYGQLVCTLWCLWTHRNKVVSFIHGMAHAPFLEDHLDSAMS